MAKLILKFLALVLAVGISGSYIWWKARAPQVEPEKIITVEELADQERIMVTGMHKSGAVSSNTLMLSSKSIAQPVFSSRKVHVEGNRAGWVFDDGQTGPVVSEPSEEKLWSWSMNLFGEEGERK